MSPIAYGQRIKSRFFPFGAPESFLMQPTTSSAAANPSCRGASGAFPLRFTPTAFITSASAKGRVQTRLTIPSRGSASGGIASGASGESSPGSDFQAAEYMGSPCSRNIVSNSVQTSFGRGIGSTRS